MKRIRCIFFDLDNTLYPAEKIYRNGLRNAWNCLRKTRPLSLPAFMKQYRLARKQVKRLLGPSPNARNRTLYFKKMTENIFGKPRPALVLEMIKAYDLCWEEIDPRDAQWVFRRLSRKYRLGVITNQVCLTQMQKMARIDPDSKWISAIVTSEEVNAEKPDPRIFLEACRRVRCAPEECAIVGDDWRQDIAASIRAGFLPVLLTRRRSGTPRGILAIRKIREAVQVFMEKP